jgi:hypothetical protein
MWIADVGQNAFEEIDFQQAASTGGENYGWRCYEGNQVYNNNGCGPASNYVFPVHVYTHGEGCSVTGGYVFRGDVTSPYYGRYFFTDYCTDMIWTLRESGGNWIREDFGQFPGNSFSTFGEDASGQLYVAGLSSETIYLVAGNATGIDEDEVLSDVRIIQEPFSGKVRIENQNNGDRLMLFNLYDLKGVNHFSDSTRNYYFEIDTGYLPSGVYFLKVTVDGKSKVQKLVNSK